MIEGDEHAGGLGPRQPSAGVLIRLATVVPQFGWSDLAQALTGNGRACDGELTAGRGTSTQPPAGKY
jgi:hypothetical protein